MRVGINQLVVLATITHQSTSLLEKMQSFIVVPWLRIDWHAVIKPGQTRALDKEDGSENLISVTRLYYWYANGIPATSSKPTL